MSIRQTFTGDLKVLPTHGFGIRSLTWWGVIAYMLIEGGGFALAGGAYFYLMSQETVWPPASFPPDLLPGALFTIIILLSEIPNTMLKKAAEAQERDRVLRLIVLLDLFGLVLLVIRGFEFAHVNVRWSDNAYGSILWALLLLHTIHILTDWAESVVLTALMFTGHGREPRRFVDVSEDALYWRFVWITWLPIFALIYLVPRVV
jgi:heme/copper-type cytochrome/quinol oxidase subunit 3